MSRPAQKSLDLLALGEPLLEFNQVQTEPPLYLQGFGGDTSNAAIAAARAGARVGYLSRLGEDAWAQRLRALWQAEGLDTRAVISDPQAPTGLYFVSHDAQGHHFSYARAGSAASRMQPQDLQGPWQELIAHSHWLHVSGISMAISPGACATVLAAMRWAREVGTRVCLDVNLRLRLWTLAEARQALLQALPLCDLFLPSLDDLAPLSGLNTADEMLAWSHAHGAGQVVLKQGAQGALCSTGTEVWHLAAHAVQAVDATGAGDCFAGNLLARLAAGEGLREAAGYANAAAALAVQGHGAVAPLPRPDAVRALLAQPS